MLCQTLTFALVALAPSLVSAAPSSARRQVHTGMVDFSGHLDSAGNKLDRRASPITGMVDFGGHLDANGNKVSERRSTLAERDSDFISSCGPEWVPVEDFKNNERWYIGYRSAVDLFCQHITHDYNGHAAVVGPGAYAGTTIYTNTAQEQVGLNSGNDPETDVTPGHIEFEIHNKQSSGDHIPTVDNCKFYLMKMATAGQSCYGNDNTDTKGGTWQIGDQDISYHALAGKN
ncbi:hypothetical protein NLU13_2531 [Sarocladium strictum]|uniref:Ecp2 effector protein domain-containing protein n=1 Tax=Sarocladium strictum TaxID=5046 RepID=A0AA39L9M5_SARSR|nr:hypothetical protein NLU13_2531 [Sarocladium strictum]